MARYTLVLLACVLFVGQYVSGSFIRSSNINDLDTEDISIPQESQDDNNEKVEDSAEIENLINKDKFEIPTDLLTEGQPQKECRKIGEFVSTNRTFTILFPRADDLFDTDFVCNDD